MEEVKPQSEHDLRWDDLLSRPENYNENKHCILQLAKVKHRIPRSLLENLLTPIQEQKDFCDWSLCLAVRLLYFDYGEDTDRITPKLTEIKNTLSTFPFWPMCSIEKCKNTFNYWSENHAFMFLSSAHLFRQKMNISYCRETSILRAVLRAKASPELGKGLYEVLSQVYLPYSLCAMVNLIDFSRDMEIVALATVVADLIVHQLALATTDQGVCSFTASARQFHRCRVRPYGHNVNQLMLIVAGVPWDFKPDSVTGTLLTSSYRPGDRINFNYLIYTEQNIERRQMNHRIYNVERAYRDMSEEECVPLYWSAGLVTHPAFIDRTKSFQDKHHLHGQIHLRKLSWLPTAFAQGFMSSMSHWSKGQNYTGIDLNLYKAPGGLMLSSFEAYNVGLCGYQQNPWMANVSGVGVWSGSGKMKKLNIFEIANLYGPHVSQKGRLLVAAYVVPQTLLRPVAMSLLTRNSYVHWPSPLFDEEMRQYRINKKIEWVIIPRSHAQFSSDRIRAGPELEKRPRESSIDDSEALAEDTVMSLEDMERIIAEKEADDVSDADSSDSSDSESESDDERLEVEAVSHVEPTASSARALPVPSQPTKKKIKKQRGIFKQLSRGCRGVKDVLSGKTEKKKRKERDKDRKGTQSRAWWVGRRGDSLIGLYCTNKTRVQRDTKAEVSLRKGGDSVQCPWRFCDYRKHAWVVRVGTVDSVHTRGKEVDNLFESLHHFATYCQSINIDLAVEGNFVNVSVVDKVEGRIHVSVDRRK